MHRHALIKSDSTVWCWGTNYGFTPVAVPGGGKWDKIDISSWSPICGLSKGNALCWYGSVYFGDMGIGSVLNEVTQSSLPLAITCGSPEGKPGEIFYNSTANKLQYCDGSKWMEMRR